jgi:hypothetical protein
MNNESIALVNRLLAIYCRSLPQYLQWSRPHVAPGQEEALETIADVARDQDALADRLSAMVIDAGSLPHTGEFPMEFTDLHDLDLGFLVAEAASYQAEDVAMIQALVDKAAAWPAVRSIAEEALGMAKGHLETLTELADRTPVAS